MTALVHVQHIVTVFQHMDQGGPDFCLTLTTAQFTRGIHHLSPPGLAEYTHKSLGDSKKLFDHRFLMTA